MPRRPPTIRRRALRGFDPDAVVGTGDIGIGADVVERVNRGLPPPGVLHAGFDRQWGALTITVIQVAVAFAFVAASRCIRHRDLPSASSTRVLKAGRPNGSTDLPSHVLGRCVPAGGADQHGGIGQGLGKRTGSNPDTAHKADSNRHVR